MDLIKESERIEMLEWMLHTVLDRLGSSELTRNQVGASRNNFGIINDLEVCITASKLLFEGDENLLEKATGIMNMWGEDTSKSTGFVIRDAKRLRPRNQGRQRLVNISFRNTEQKISVLWNTQKNPLSLLQKCDSEKRQNTCLIKLNARTLLYIIYLTDTANDRIRLRKTAAVNSNIERVNTISLMQLLLRTFMYYTGINSTRCLSQYILDRNSYQRFDDIGNSKSWYINKKKSGSLMYICLKWQ